MPRVRLNQAFYALPADQAAPLLLGKWLCRQHAADLPPERYRIVETECYYGETDTACHAHRGKTPRTAVLYEPGGIAYVYLVYGIHNMLNVITGPADHPEGVLIRGIEGYTGPGRLTKHLAVDRTLNREDLLTSHRLWLEEEGPTADGTGLSTAVPYTTTPRIGISYATAEDQNRPWRFVAT
jgi:DNA-3-methyladenine glycosylase